VHGRWAPPSGGARYSRVVFGINVANARGASGVGQIVAELTVGAAASLCCGKAASDTIGMTAKAAIATMFGQPIRTNSKLIKANPQSGHPGPGRNVSGRYDGPVTGFVQTLSIGKIARCFSALRIEGRVFTVHSP
jgi:hypothetical protein